jgi:NADH-quinone oxidoreductase subunit J
MLLFFLLFFTFSSLAVISSSFVIFTTNPVFSALFLVLSFCNVSSLLFLLQIDFLPIVFLVVYVGAIVVLFLFVLMMLNIKITEFRTERLHYVSLMFVFGLVFIVESLVIFCFELIPLNIFDSNHYNYITDLVVVSSSSSEFSSFSIDRNNIAVLGEMLFSEFYLYFLLSSFILLLAMIAAITSTLDKKFIAKSQFIYAQVLRSFESSIIKY